LPQIGARAQGFAAAASDAGRSSHGPASAGRRGVIALAAALGLTAAGCAYRSIPGWRYQPPMFSLSRPDAPGRITLLGSVHAGLTRFYPLPEPVEAAFDGAARLLVELDARAQAGAIRSATAAAALLPDGGTIDQVLQAPTMAALTRAFQADPWALQRLMRLQPWAIALLLPNADDANMLVDGGDGIETHLIDRSRRRGLPVIELESAAAQIAAFAGGSREEQDAMLALRLAQRSGWDRTYSEIIDAWRSGNMTELAALKDRAFPASADMTGLRRRLFTERDQAMAIRLRDELETPAPGLAVIGVLHLAGPDAITGILSTLGVRVGNAGVP
jgi:uncharacterized protein YbaP (TraB family)